MPDADPILDQQADPVNVKLILAAVVAVLLLGSLGQTIITPALPIIVGDLGGIEYISWAMTAYFLAATISAPVSGKLGDMFGRKIVIQTGIVIFLAGSILAALSASLPMLVLARGVQGLGGGSLIVSAMAAVADVLPPRQRGKAQGLIGAAFGVSTVIGPFIGGVIVEQFSWHWLFAVNVPVGLAALLIISIAFATNTDRINRKIDYLGAATLAMFLMSSVLYASVGGTILPWGSPVALGIVAVSVASLTAFILAEQRAEEPIIPLFLFRNNAFVVSNTVGFATGTVMFGSITFVPAYLQIVSGFTPMQAGLSILPLMVGLLGVSMTAGYLMSRTGRYKFMPVIGMGLATVGTMLLSTITPQTSYAEVAVYLFLVGAGCGPAMSIGVAAIQNSVPKSVLGVGTASVNMFRQTGGSLGVAALGAIFANRLVHELGAAVAGEGSHFDLEVLNGLPAAARDAAIAGYAEALHPVFWAAAIIALLGMAVGMFLREEPMQGHPGHQAEAAE